MQIRPAEAPDLSEVARVWRTGWLEAHVGNVPDALMAERTEAYFARTAADLLGSTLLAVDDDGTLLGVVLLDGDELFQLAVAPQARRRGVGEALVSAAEERIAADHDRAQLLVVPANLPARRLYERCGWTDLGVTVKHVRAANPDDPPVPVTVHHVVKQLR